MHVINDFAEVLKKAPEEVFRELNGGGPVQHNTIDTNNGSCINVQQNDVEQLKLLYQQIIDEKQRNLDEKERYIRVLERQLGVNG
jgi:hypothetical protein